MKMFRGYLIACLSVAVSLICLMAAPVVAAVQRHVIEPLGAFFSQEPVGLQHGAILAAIGDGGSGSITQSQRDNFLARREARLVAVGDAAFARSIPRQGGLLAA